jgi:hypothetical protein
MDGNESLSVKNESIGIINKGQFEHVMSDTERDIMREIISFFKKNKAILEIGYGMGISANLIQQKNPIIHTIVEVHSDIYNMANEWKSKNDKFGGINIIFGDWVNSFEKIGNNYDIVFHDTHRDTNINNFLDFIRPKLNQSYSEVYFVYYPDNDSRIEKIELKSRLVGNQHHILSYPSKNKNAKVINFNDYSILSTFPFVSKATLINGKYKEHKSIL